MKTGLELIREGETLSNMVHPRYDNTINPPLFMGLDYEDEIRYKKWLEEVQGYVYKNSIYPEQYETFIDKKTDVSEEKHGEIMAILKSIVSALE
ncbi:MAG: hypothetical protein K6E96_05470 [Bacteroidales bacterium]|nr:hypothetical protein [Bacteroidales bacterium]